MSGVGKVLESQMDWQVGMDGVDYKCQGPLNGTLKLNLMQLGLDVVIVDHPFNIYSEDIKTQLQMLAFIYITT